MGYVASSNTAYIGLYRPPRCPEAKFKEALTSIESWIIDLERTNERTPSIVLGGDINFPAMRGWGLRDMEDMSANPLARIANDVTLGEDKAQILRMIEFVDRFSLTQEVQANTRGENILDVIFTNDPNYIEDIEIISNLKISDHNFIVATTNRDTIKTKENKKVNFCSTNIPLYNLKAGDSENWNRARQEFKEYKYEDNLSVEDLAISIKMNLESTVKNNFKIHAPPTKPEGKSKNFIPREVRCILRRKLNASRSIRTTEDEVKRTTLKNKIESLEEQLRIMEHSRRKKIENIATKDIKKNFQKFFEYVKKISKTSDKVGPFKRDKNNVNLSAAEIISLQYKKVFSTPKIEDNIGNPTNFFDVPTNNDDIGNNRFLETFIINENEVKKSIDLLPAKSAPRPDGITNLLLKELKHELAPILTKLFKKSVETGVIPSDYKTATIKPIKKPKKPRSDPASFRPVSLTSGISKILERIVKPQVQKFLKDNSLLSNSQHGFRQRRSCLSQLLEHYDEVVKDLEDGKVSDVVYLDFAKAFNSVDHMILARETRKIGIIGQAGVWLHEFLQDRTQKVVAENLISEPVKMVSGVPQGTVLGPVLFLIMINTLSELDLSSRIKLFADDTRISNGIRTEDDIVNLQDDLDKIFKWKSDHNMKFNADKFEKMSHGSDFKTNQSIPRSTYQNDEKDNIKNKKVVRDLGIEMAESADFTDHINLICKRARDKGDWVFRNFYRRDQGIPEFYVADIYSTYI